MTSSKSTLCIVRSSLNIDEFFAVPHIVKKGETISSSGLTSRAGGKGANASAALGLAGANVALVGAVGKDASWPVDELKKKNVMVEKIQILDDLPTGRAFIQIAEDGENSIVLLKGANYSEAEALASPETAFNSFSSQPTHLILQNEIPLAHTKSFLSHAASKGVCTVFNPSPMLEVSEIKDFKWNQVSVLIVNGGEALDLVEAFGQNASSIQEGDDEKILEALESLEELKAINWLVMTRGARGVIAKVRIQGQEDRSLFSIPACKPRSVSDTTGAGDTFLAYLSSGLMEEVDSKKLPSEQEVKKVLGLATQASAIAVEKKGAMSSIPSREEVEKRMSEA